MNVPVRFVLASLSERRKDLLRAAGMTFEVVHPEVDETISNGSLPPEQVVLTLAERKVMAAVRAHPDRYILGADTVVSIGGDILGKPQDSHDAANMLRRLSGNSHWVYTGVALYDPKRKCVGKDWDCTKVDFGALDDDEISWYVSTGEPMDKAGAYALQGAGAFFVKRLEGDYSSVIGLPLPKVYGLFKSAGVGPGDLFS